MTTLADLTTLHLGGPAARVVEADTEQTLVDAIRHADAAGEPVLLLGGGSNLVVGDAGWDGVVVLVRTRGVAVEREADRVRLTVQAGENWDEVVARTVAEGWSGLAAMSGIPGLVGATPVQNVGAYGSEIADVLLSLNVLDRRTGEVGRWPAERCGFGFRTSAFKHTDRFVVLDVELSLTVSDTAPPVRYLELAHRLGVEPGGLAPSAAVRREVLALRAGKGMLLDAADHDTWSVGSFFVNPLVPPADVPDGCPQWTVAEDPDRRKLSAAWLIERAGFHKGYGNEHVAVSRKHTLALTNRGDATTAQLLDLAHEISDGVHDRFGVRLGPEAHLAGVSWQ